jgi:hypothetical protein
LALWFFRSTNYGRHCNDNTPPLGLLSTAAASIYEFTTGELDFVKSNWLIFFGAASALLGWIIAAIVSMRNITRQHTITTLLQSRLSEFYVTQGRKFGTHFPKGTKLTEQDINGPFTDAVKGEAVNALKYLLNHYEFIAIAINLENDRNRKETSNRNYCMVCALANIHGCCDAHTERA